MKVAWDEELYSRKSNVFADMLFDEVRIKRGT